MGGWDLTWPQEILDKSPDFSVAPRIAARMVDLSRSLPLRHFSRLGTSAVLDLWAIDQQERSSGRRRPKFHSALAGRRNRHKSIQRDQCDRSVVWLVLRTNLA